MTETYEDYIRRLQEQSTVVVPTSPLPEDSELRRNYPMSGIAYPDVNDVMCGRGGASNNHIGNIRFRHLVAQHKSRYMAASKSDKPKVAMEVVQIWRSLNPPGRFLTKTEPDKGEDSLWHDVGEKTARTKASQCLREKTPEMKKFQHYPPELGKPPSEQDDHAPDDDENNTKETSPKNSPKSKRSTIRSSLPRTVVSGSISRVADGDMLPAPVEPMNALKTPTPTSHTTRAAAAMNTPAAAALSTVFDDDMVASEYDKQTEPDTLDDYDDTQTMTDGSVMERLSTNSWLQNVYKPPMCDTDGTAPPLEQAEPIAPVFDRSNGKRSSAVPPRINELQELCIGESCGTLMSDLTDLVPGKQPSSRSVKMSDFASPRHQNSLRSSKMSEALTLNSYTSMFSEITPVKQGSVRSAKMSEAGNMNSNASMISDVSSLLPPGKVSEALAAFAENPAPHDAGSAKMNDPFLANNYEMFPPPNPMKQSSTRSAKMRDADNMTSNLSMLSELTDVSASMKNMELNG